MDEIRIGLVGAGFMGRVHSAAYRNADALFGGDLPDIHTLLVSDENPSFAETAVRRWGWTRAVSDWRDVTGGDVDIVDICTPNDSHVPIALAALEGGKHVLCEKPLALTADDAHRLCLAASKAERLTQVGFVYRQWPAVAMARKFIDEGAVGDIRSARAWFLLDYNADPSVPMSWRFDRARAGSGALGDVGSHCIDLLQHLVGPISEVTARQRTFVPIRVDAGGSRHEVTVDDQTEILATFDSGATGTILASWAATGHKCDLGFEIIGANGALSFSWERSNELRFYDATEPADRQGFRTILIGPVHPGGQGIHTVAAQGLGYNDAFMIAATQTLKHLGGDRSITPPSFVDGLRVAEVTDAVIEAAITGSAIPVERRSL